MNKYKLIAIDIDGTLVNEKKIISPITKESILKAHEKGVQIVIATGRSYPAAAQFYNQFNFNIPLILYNGSCVRNSKSDDIILNKTFNTTLAKTIFGIINKHKGVCCLWKNNELYFNFSGEYAQMYEKITSIKPTIIENVDEFDVSDIYKFIWFDMPENFANIKSNILANINGINYFTSQKYMLEIVPMGVSKGDSLKFLTDSFGIKREEVIAIGDDENDISMIEFAGLGVAMANAKEIVKTYADYITDSNEKNGVAKVINKYLL